MGGNGIRAWGAPAVLFHVVGFVFSLWNFWQRDIGHGLPSVLKILFGLILLGFQGVQRFFQRGHAGLGGLRRCCVTGLQKCTDGFG